MTNGIQVPGVIYSMLLAGAAYLLEYFTTGSGAGVPWAPILIAAIPVLLKLFTATGEETPEMASRGMESAQKCSYASKVLWG